MGFFTKILAATIQGTVGTVLGVAKDAVTLGGALDDTESATATAVKGAFDKTSEAIEDLSEGDVL